MGERLFFTADDAQRGRELWVSDGTAASTRPAADIVPGAASSIPVELNAFKDRFYFRLAALAGLWVSGSWPLDLPAGEPARSTRIGPALYFVGRDPAIGRELWTLNFDAGVDGRLWPLYAGK